MYDPTSAATNGRSVSNLGRDSRETYHRSNRILGVGACVCV